MGCCMLSSKGVADTQVRALISKQPPDLLGALSATSFTGLQHPVSLYAVSEHA